MSDTYSSVALLDFLRNRAPLYYGKALELREAIKGWLAYVPQSFPHYTRHTIEHSDEIIAQMSRLLFRDGLDPVIDLSPVEAYILSASAYLHDAGMVASDDEKARILESEEWKRWTGAGGGGSRRWQDIQELRHRQDPPDEQMRHFLADIQTRFLIAEFIRRIHHLRSGDVIREHHSVLGRFAFDDPVLSRTIADVCIAHGLRHFELDDPERFPDRRDVRGQPTNVRFLATALRLGDLLDMSHDRACPVLLNAACPLPGDSLAHWTQYQRIRHRVTAPDRIEITAECQSQDEHRVLQDWCQWIVDETKGARHLMARSLRHRHWQVPFAEMEGSSPSIVIRPAGNATYIPSKWTFELDPEAVFERLIHDVYQEPAAFIRELVQNALDANRCQMYLDLPAHGLRPTEFPNEVPAEIREQYPVRITVTTRVVRNELSGEEEERQVLAVEDVGIGMDREIIHRYFLQVGRSYYTTDEFRRRFTFAPSSRFGVGFLSVFAVSDTVVVETYKPKSAAADGPLRLTLHGPRKYLLTERGQRRVTGTRIEVWMREGLPRGELLRHVARWCRRVEFPIVVQEFDGEARTIRSEVPDEFVYSEPLPTGPEARVCVRAFPVQRPGIFGELYVLAYIDERGESWAHSSWLRYTLPAADPRVGQIRFPENLLCSYGIAVGGGGTGSFTGGMTGRLDLRAERFRPALARAGGVRSLRAARFHTQPERPLPEVVSRWEEILTEHLAFTPRATGEDAWQYKQALMEDFPFESFWAADPAMIPVRRRGEREVVGIGTVQVAPAFTVLLERHMLGSGRFWSRDELKVGSCSWDSDEIAIMNAHLARLSSAHRAVLFGDRFVQSARYLNEEWAAIVWAKGTALSRLGSSSEDHVDVAELPEANTIAWCIHKTTQAYSEHVVANAKHPFIEWLSRVCAAAREGAGLVTADQAARLIKLAVTAARYPNQMGDLVRFVDRWRAIPGLPSGLRPPDLELSAELFDPVAADRYRAFAARRRRKADAPNGN